MAIRLNIKAVPGSSRSAIAGWLGDTLKVRVTAPPERGKANAAIEAAVAEALGVPSESVRVIAGQASPRKVLELEGVTQEDIDRRFPRGNG
jgi:uncharacterized protein (TIGR00251 family)